MSIFDTIGSLLGKSDNSPMSVPEALVAALGSQEGGLGSLVQNSRVPASAALSRPGSAPGQISRWRRMLCTAYWGAISFSRFQQRPGCRSPSCCRKSHSICQGLLTA